MSRECVYHHHACDCREAKFREMETLLQKVADSLWNVKYPGPPGKSGREWVSEFTTYLRGSAMAMIELEPHEMRELEGFADALAAPAPPTEPRGEEKP